MAAERIGNDPFPVPGWLHSVDLPSCGMPCITATHSNYNLTYECGNAQKKDNIDKCVQQICSLPEAVFIRNKTEIACRTPVRDQSQQIKTIFNVCAGVSTFFITLRLVYQLFFSVDKRLGYDDWVASLTIPIRLGTIVTVQVTLTCRGLGRDIWGVTQSDFINIARSFDIVQILYVVLMGLIKISLCFFYLKIFAGTIIRRLLWGTIIFHLLLTTAIALASILMCVPIDYQWNRFDYDYDATPNGYCNNWNNANWSYSIINIISDLWLLAIPLSQIIGMNIHWKEKTSAIIMFLTGIGITVVSCIRLSSVLSLSRSTNMTWEQGNIVKWSAIEILVGTACTCLPALRLTLLRIAPRVFGSRSSTYY